MRESLKIWGGDSIKTLEDLERAFETGLREWESQIVEKQANIMGNKVVREVKRLTPVITGNLRRRWFYRVKRVNGKVIIFVSSDSDYAASVNNGHRIVRGKKTVGFAKGKRMLERGIEVYKQNHMKEDVESMLDALRKAMK